MSKDKKYYVTMSDKFMSGWGLAKNKINKIVIECDNYNQACELENNAKKQSENYKYINICSKKPNYNKKCYLTSDYNYNEFPIFHDDRS
jgi:hypothetical protein